MRSSKEMIAAAQKQLGIIQPRLTRFAVNQEIIFLCHSPPGHTPGQAAIRISSDDAVLFTQQMSYTTRHKSLNPRWQPAFADPCKQLKPVSKF